MENTATRWKVFLMESERGWGSRVDEIKYFESYAEARDFVKRFNAPNNLDKVPDWYMYATEPKAVQIDLN